MSSMRHPVVVVVRSGKKSEPWEAETVVVVVVAMVVMVVSTSENRNANHDGVRAIVVRPRRCRRVARRIPIQRSNLVSADRHERHLLLVLVLLLLVLLLLLVVSNADESDSNGKHNC